jgi:hypothetical protein
VSEGLRICITDRSTLTLSDCFLVILSASFKAFGCFRIGASPLIDLEEGIVKAIALAKECDAVIVCAGLNEDYESEGCECSSG